MKLRKPKKRDNEYFERAYQLLLNLIIKYQKELEPSLWVSAMICALSKNYKNSDISFEDFKAEMLSAIDFYKY